MEGKEHKTNNIDIEVTITVDKDSCTTLNTRQKKHKSPKKKQHKVSSAAYFYLCLVSFVICIIAYLVFFGRTQQKFLFYTIIISGFICFLSFITLVNRFSKRYFNEEHDYSDCQYPYFGF